MTFEPETPSSRVRGRTPPLEISPDSLRDRWCQTSCESSDLSVEMRLKTLKMSALMRGKDSDDGNVDVELSRADLCNHPCKPFSTWMKSRNQDKEGESETDTGGEYLMGEDFEAEDEEIQAEEVDPMFEFDP
mmetsp:Transcript_10149/g.22496  ORF Transcript_10149/g.22496 Transcript_10149/m.22496 type:complete len:132 (-) Transcript_10149:285-680(-)